MTNNIHPLALLFLRFIVGFLLFGFGWLGEMGLFYFALFY